MRLLEKHFPCEGFTHTPFSAYAKNLGFIIAEESSDFSVQEIKGGWLLGVGHLLTVILNLESPDDTPG